MKADGFITAGGRSSRMGRDKAWLELGGRVMIEWVIAALRPVTSNLYIIANDCEYARLGLPVFADTNTGIGPLEAIRTAMANSRAPRLVIAGCDLPFVTSELFAFLLAIAGNHQAVVPIGRDGRLQPLCAVYSTGALEAVTSLIESGERKVDRLFERIPVRLVAFNELSHLQGAEVLFENVNTDEDYKRAVSILSRSDVDGT